MASAANDDSNIGGNVTTVCSETDVRSETVVCRQKITRRPSTPEDANRMSNDDFMPWDDRMMDQVHELTPRAEYFRPRLV